MRSAAAIAIVTLVAVVVGCASTSSPPASSPVPVAPTPTATAVVPPSALPAPRPPVPTPAPSDVVAGDLTPPLINVLLERSMSPVELPQPQRAWRVIGDDDARWLYGPLRIEVESESTWQVGAYRDEQSATSVAYRLTAALGPDAMVWRERAADGLVRVRVRWAGDGPSDPRAALSAAGETDVLEVAGASRIAVEGTGGRVVADTELELAPSDSWPVAYDGRRYRGRIVVRSGRGGELLVINRLSLESYLRGVVPVEMGPAVFPELEALKAQAVAARTYAVAHLGDHADEGYDLCDTPACQAYGGAGAEHRLSDRAVRDTAGLVATWNSEPIDAMYSSTCGGHTEDAAVLFPDRAQPYLVGVPCAWDRSLELRGSGSDDGDAVGRTAFSATVAADLLGLEPTAAAGDVAAAVARRVGRPAPSAGDLDPAGLAAALLEIAGLETAGQRLTPHAEPLEQLLFLADLHEVDLDPPTADTAAWWSGAAALAVLELHGDVTADHGEAVPRPDGVGIFPRRAERSEPLAPLVPLWERFGGTYRAPPSAVVRPGTLLERLRVGDAVRALVVVRSDGDGEADRRSAWREWIREREWTELGTALGLPDLERLRVTARAASGRVVGLEAIGAGGGTRSFSGFDVRRALDLPDTLFAMHVRTDPTGRRFVRFLGRGWGHGVGLCQHGSYGLARSGMRFDAILRHYYRGIELSRWPEGATP